METRTLYMPHKIALYVSVHNAESGSMADDDERVTIKQRQ
jgi:hypothetical protein